VITCICLFIALLLPLLYCWLGNLTHKVIHEMTCIMCLVVNSHLVCDPTIRQPGFDLPRQQWSLLKRFRTEQGHCGACRRKWRLTGTDQWRDPRNDLYNVSSGQFSPNFPCPALDLWLTGDHLCG